MLTFFLIVAAILIAPTLIYSLCFAAGAAAGVHHLGKEIKRKEDRPLGND